MLRLEHITAGYDGTTVLRDVSLAVPAGSVVAMLGPNGAGKTTLLRVASGLLRPTSGRVTSGGHDITGAPSHRIRSHGICHVPEGRGVFKALSVRENIRLFCRPGEEPLALDRAVDAFPELGRRLDQVAGTMSGGEQQMLALVHAYVSDARVVLLDEVSMGLAPMLVDQIFAFLARLADEGVSLLLVEQYVGKALAIAQYVTMLDGGRISFVGEPDELDEDDIVASYLSQHVAPAETSSVQDPQTTTGRSTT